MRHPRSLQPDSLEPSSLQSNTESMPGIGLLAEKAREISGFKRAIPRVEPLCGDGSDRKFFRISSGSFSYVGLLSPRTRLDRVDENDSYLSIGRHLHSKGIQVPRFIYADPQQGHFLLEDAGDLHLQRFVLSNRSNLEKNYRHVLHMLVAMHRRSAEGFLPQFCFDTALYDPDFVYERELEYFRKSFLVGFLGSEVGPDELRSDFETLADEAGSRQLRFVFHRDFQSRNIMVHRNKLWLIDFQGMRFGPPAYDLASLLMDPYVMLPSRLQEKLVWMYWSAAGRFLDCSCGEFLKTYNAVRLCRNLQILGAFGFLGIVKGKRYFLDHIPWAWGQLREWLQGACRGKYPKLEKLVNRVRGIVPHSRWNKI
jgi:N-acetylmuramate 1-kinase